jgi:hypothetical protein
VSSSDQQAAHDYQPSADDPTIPELEVDETIPPRPEEEAADLARAEPDTEDHSQHEDQTPHGTPPAG